mgnify:CR=1 FL=1
MELWLIWIIIAVVLIIVEVLTQMLWALCLGAGAILAMAASLLGVDLVWQIVIMAVAALGFYLVAFPWFRKIHNARTAHTARTGMDALLGRRAIVTETVRPGSLGRARIDGDNWQAVSADASPIDVGTKVRVTGYDSIILTVEREEE